MEIVTKTIKRIKISREEVTKIIKRYFIESHGIVIEGCSPLIQTVYDGSLGDPGTEEFMGFEINSGNSEIKSPIEI